jgi:hypothetical protein
LHRSTFVPERSPGEAGTWLASRAARARHLDLAAPARPHLHRPTRHLPHLAIPRIADRGSAAGCQGEAKSIQDRRGHTRLTSGSHRDRRPGHSSDRTACGADRPHHPLARLYPVRAGAAAGGDRRGTGPPGGSAVLLRYDDERHWLRAARKQAGHPFTRLPARSEYNTRVKNAAPLPEAALRWPATRTPATAELVRPLDATPSRAASPRSPRSARACPAGPGTATAPATRAGTGEPS